MQNHHIALKAKDLERTIFSRTSVHTIHLWDFTSLQMVKEVLHMLDEKWQVMELNAIYCHQFPSIPDLKVTANSMGFIFVPISNQPKDVILVKPESSTPLRTISIHLDSQIFKTDAQIAGPWFEFKNNENLKLSIPLLVIARSASEPDSFALIPSPTFTHEMSIYVKKSRVESYLTRITCHYLLVFLTGHAQDDESDFDFLTSVKFGCKTLHFFGTFLPEEFDEEFVSTVLLKQIDTLCEVIFDGVRGTSRITEEMASVLDDCGVVVTEILSDDKTGDQVYQTDPPLPKRSPKRKETKINWNISVLG